MKEVETHHKTGCYLLWFDLMMIKEKRREDEWKEREREGAGGKSWEGVG